MSDSPLKVWRERDGKLKVFVKDAKTGALIGRVNF